MLTDLPELFRTKKNGSYKRCTNSWGTFFKKVDDPEGIDIKPENYFELNPNFGKIPASTWDYIISLYRKYMYQGVGHGSTEVQVILLNNENDFNEWKVVVPNQNVTSASVSSNLMQSIDLITGEEYKTYPPNGYVVSGSSHSHAQMSAFFSGVDDKSELHSPGVHIVVGQIKDNSYTLKCSVTLCGKRYILSPDQLIDLTSDHKLYSIKKEPEVYYIENSTVQKLPDKLDKYVKKPVYSLHQSRLSYVPAKKPTNKKQKTWSSWYEESRLWGDWYTDKEWEDADFSNHNSWDYKYPPLTNQLEEDNSNWELVEEIIDEEFLLDPNGTTERLLLKLNELGMLKDSELEMLGIKVVK